MDVICQAKSGMGKTAVFALASLQQLEPKNDCVSVLVICHARELAFQISKEFKRYGKYTHQQTQLEKFETFCFGRMRSNAKSNRYKRMVRSPDIHHDFSKLF